MKNLQKGSVLVWVIVIIVIVAGVGLYFYSQNKSSSTSSETVQNSSDWKTYTDNYLGITFKYPSDWFVIPTSNPEIGNIALMIQSSQRHTYFEQHPDGPGGPIAEINISKDNLRNEGESVMFNGMKAMRLTYSGDGSMFESILISRNNYTYDIRTESIKGNIESEILSSIKFTN